MISKVRMFVLMVVVTALGAVALGSGLLQGDNPPNKEKKMHGLIGKLSAVEGKRDAVIAILLEGMKEMPGCLSYVVAKDPADATAIWITEAWDSQASHKAALSLPAVQEAIIRGKPLIAKFDATTVTEPVGGHGLSPVKGR